MQTRADGTGPHLPRHGTDHGGVRRPGPVARLDHDEDGVTAIEYGLMATLIGIAFTAGALALGLEVGELYEFVRQAVVDVTT